MEEIDLKELLKLFYEKKVTIILITLVFAILGIIYSMFFITPKYQSSTKLLLATNSSAEVPNESISTTEVTVNSKLVSTYSELVKGSNKIIRTVISNLGIDANEETIKKEVSVTNVTNTEVIEIKVRNQDPVLAAKIANEIAKVFIENIKEYYGIENVHIVDKAEVSQSPANIHHGKNIALFTFVGLVIALVYVLLANMLDTTIKSEEDIENVSGIMVLASIPFYDQSEEKNNNTKKGGKK